VLVVGCVEALAEERALLLCYWLVHRPPGPTPLLLALRLLHALAITPPAAWAAAAQGGLVYLLTVLLPATPATPEFKVPFMGLHYVFSCCAFALRLPPTDLCSLNTNATIFACLEWCGYVVCSVNPCCHGCFDVGRWAAPCLAFLYVDICVYCSDWPKPIVYVRIFCCLPVSSLRQT
jgi:hypothetical protein